MKKSVNHSAFFLLVLFTTMFAILTSCKDDNLFEPELPLNPELASPNGSIMSFLNGSVMLFIPEGAVNQPVTLKINVCNDEENCYYNLKAFSIEPFIVFNKPVTMKIRYDGELSTENSICDGIRYSAFFWNEMEGYQSRQCGNCVFCSVDTTSRIFTTAITRTGIYAIGPSLNNGISQ